MTEMNQHQDVKDAARDAVMSGDDIYRQIKAITLKALTRRQLDLENMNQVAHAVIHGIDEGVSSQGESARERFKQAATALDDALAVAAEASKLAIEEAASRVNDFSAIDLNRATEELKSMEDMFLETLERVARGGNQVMGDIVTDFIHHAQQSGTAVGKQVFTALEALKDLPHQGREALISSAVNATSMLAQLGSGILSGIAESLQSSQTKK
ncbi:MAG: DUF6781 family protein [Gammaproteobacteria bacterium]